MMLVICEECAKKYNVDETQIKSDKARFNCKKCGHPIIVYKADAGHTTNAWHESFSEKHTLR